MKRHLIQKIINVKPIVKTLLEDDRLIKRCEKCGNELLVLSRQTRSADEGATTFYRCLKCCKTFKIG
jgi:DNA-directed RNA polymerase subunit M/transcription elongation factor TFIIS